MHMSLSKLQETMKDREACVLQSMELQRVKYDWATEKQAFILLHADVLYEYFFYSQKKEREEDEELNKDLIEDDALIPFADSHP